MTSLRLDPARTALLVVDMQNDFCAPGGFFERGGLDIGPGGAIADRIRRLLDDVRPLGVHVVFTKSARRDPQPQVLRPSRPFYRQPAADDRPFEPGTWGSEIVDALPVQPDDVVVEKPRYSAFFRTGLDETLRNRGIDTVLLTGTTTNCCVDATMRDAYYLDFNVLVVEDCVAGFGGEEHLHDATLENAKLLFGVVATAEDATAALAGAEQPVAAG
jgi:ureidoacrylate peracid hydrolase